MNYRLMIGIAALAVSLLGCDSSQDIPLDAQPKPKVEQVTAIPVELDGKYQVLEAPFTGMQATRPYLIEFFWFGCPHCYNLDPLVQAFKQANPNFQFGLIPAAPNPRWEIEARLYYAMEQLGLLPRYFQPVFKLYADTREEKRFPTIDELVELFSAEGVDKAQLEAAMQSETVSQKIVVSNRLFDQAKLTGVPSLIVNGKYKLELGGLDPKNFVEDFDRTIKALGQLD